ncbi:hypothetical protein Tco_0531952 [Tanacetum coccineum]
MEKCFPVAAGNSPGTFVEEKVSLISESNEDDNRVQNADIRSHKHASLIEGSTQKISIYSINHYIDATHDGHNIKWRHHSSTISRFPALNDHAATSKDDNAKIQLKLKVVNNICLNGQHEAHANENKMMLERLTQQTVDPLALMSNVSPQHYHSQSSTNPPSPYSEVDRTEAGGNSATTATEVRPHSKNCTQPKCPQNSKYFQRQDVGDASSMRERVLMTCDAFDSDVDEAPIAQTMFMANLSSADPFL